MKTFIITYNTNYGLAVLIINASTKDKAILVAEAEGAWAGFETVQIDTVTSGTVFWEVS